MCLLATGGWVRVDGWSGVREERGFHVQLDAGELSVEREEGIQKATRANSIGPGDWKNLSAHGRIMHKPTTKLSAKDPHTSTAA